MFKNTSKNDSEQLNQFIEANVQISFINFINDYFEAAAKKHREVLHAVGV